MVDCIRPGDISDDDLIGYAAGESTRRVREHVRACPRCTAVAAQYAAAEERLGRVLFGVDCPTSLELGEYYLDLLPASTMRRLGAHLVRCPHCMAELATAAGFLDGPERSEPTPARAPDAGQRIEQALRRVVAHLLPSPRPAAALRGASQPVTLLYEAEDLTLTLHPQHADRPRHHAQLLGFVHQRETSLDSLTGASVRLLRDNAPVAATTIDEIGSFIIGPVPPGSYDLEVTTPTMRVLAPDLDLL